MNVICLSLSFSVCVSSNNIQKWKKCHHTLLLHYLYICCIIGIASWFTIRWIYPLNEWMNEWFELNEYVCVCFSISVYHPNNNDVFFSLSTVIFGWNVFLVNKKKDVFTGILKQKTCTVIITFLLAAASVSFTTLFIIDRIHVVP